MDSHTLLSEFKRLVIENKRKFLVIFFIASVFLLAFQIVPKTITERTNSEAADENTVGVENNTLPAIFEMYIEYVDGGVYTNTLLLEEMLKTDAIIDQLKNETGIDLAPLLQKEQEEEYVKTASDRGVLGASRNESSNIWVFGANTGNSEDNLKIMEFYYNKISNNEIPLLQNRNTYFISHPRKLTEEELVEKNDSLFTDDTSSSINLRYILLSVIISLFSGLMITFFIMAGITFFDNKIQYAFNYSWNEQDSFIIADTKGDSVSLESLTPLKRETIVLSQSPSVLIKEFKSMAVDSLEELLDSTKEQEVMILVQPKITEKKWYNKQRELANFNNNKIKIVQINTSDKKQEN